MNIYGIDFNLLKALDALISEKSVTKAAIKIGITQPAMSNSLARIRKILGDKILVHTSKSMTLTPRAEKIYPLIRSIILNSEKIFSNEDTFNPINSSYTFKISASDYTGYIYGPKLLHYLNQHFPNIKVEITPLKENFSISLLESSKVDLSMVAGFQEDLPPGLYYRKFATDKFHGAICRCNDSVNKRLTLKKYLAAPHLFVNPVGLDAHVVDRVLEQDGNKRKIVSILPHFSVGLKSLCGSNYILTLPKEVLSSAKETMPIDVFPLPFDTPEIPLGLLWHEKDNQDSRHIWFRNLINNLFGTSGKK